MLNRDAHSDLSFCEYQIILQFCIFKSFCTSFEIRSKVERFADVMTEVVTVYLTQLYCNADIMRIPINVMLMVKAITT